MQRPVREEQPEVPSPVSPGVWPSYRYGTYAYIDRKSFIISLPVVPIEYILKPLMADEFQGRAEWGPGSRSSADETFGLDYLRDDSQQRGFRSDG